MKKKKKKKVRIIGSHLPFQSKFIDVCHGNTILVTKEANGISKVHRVSLNGIGQVLFVICTT